MEDFIVGRYEAGTSDVTLKSGKKIGDERLVLSYWHSDNYLIQNVTEESKPTTKANEIPYSNVNVSTAETMAKRMYDTSYVHSGLITGTQWDVMLNFISDEEDKSIENASDGSKYTDLKANSTWGNHSDTTLTECEGKYCIIDISNGSMVSDWKENTTKTNRISGYALLTTGSTEEVKKKNLYDVAGNLFEIVQEVASTVGWTSIRGSSFTNSYSSYPVCSRYGEDYFNNAYTYNGFRPVLYIK